MIESTLAWTRKVCRCNWTRGLYLAFSSYISKPCSLLAPRFAPRKFLARNAGMRRQSAVLSGCTDEVMKWEQMSQTSVMPTCLCLGVDAEVCWICLPSLARARARSFSGDAACVARVLDMFSAVFLLPSHGRWQ